MQIDDSDPVIKAFASAAMNTEFTAAQLFDAVYWFKAGWESRPANSYGSSETDDRGNVHVAGVSSPYRGPNRWTPERRKKHSEAMRRIHAAKKKRAFKAGQKAKG